MTVPPLPDGTVLLHVGPHKTGTTALQNAAGSRRRELQAHGVTYPGSKRNHHSMAAMALTGREFGWSNRGANRPAPAMWERLCRAVANAPDRAFVSSEFFDEVRGDQVAACIEDLGGDRVHVVVTLRPLTKILPSSWQQYLKSGTSRTYESWLDNVLADPPDANTTPSFWVRQDHADLVQRWVNVVGPERVTVVVLDGTDHALLPRTFEQLLGLPAGLLDPPPEGRTNRSMTAAECELVRQTNARVNLPEVDWRAYAILMRFGAIVRMVETRDPSPLEPTIGLPHWARVRAAELGAAAAAGIEQLGVRVIGDLSALAPDPGAPDAGRDAAAVAAPDTITIDAASAALTGSVAAALHERAYFDDARERLAARRDAELTSRHAQADGAIGGMLVREAGTTDLVRVVRARAVSRVRRRLRRS